MLYNSLFTYNRSSRMNLQKRWIAISHVLRRFKEVSHERHLRHLNPLSRRLPPSMQLLRVALKSCCPPLLLPLVYSLFSLRSYFRCLPSDFSLSEYRLYYFACAASDTPVSLPLSVGRFLCSLFMWWCLVNLLDSFSVLLCRAHFVSGESQSPVAYNGARVVRFRYE